MAMRTYTISVKDAGSSPDVWTVLRDAEGEQQLMSEILRLVDNRDPKISIQVVRTA